MANISILLGAGFSQPMGYPTVNVLNQKITEVTPETFGLSTVGTIQKIVPEQIENYKNNSYWYDMLFFCEVVSFYTNKVGGFHYEEFYDFIRTNLVYLRNKETESKVEPEFQKFISNFLSNPFRVDLTALNLVSRSLTTLSQFVKYFLKDRNNQQYYERANIASPVEFYNGFLKTLQILGAKNKVYIHTLNHDNLMEYFRGTEYINGEISDGFDEMNSDYYGQIGYTKIRLEFYQEKYEKQFNLIKLHSGINYYPYLNQNGVVETYVKLPPNIPNWEIYKEVDKETKPRYQQCITNYGPDFLSGTTSKILRYSEPAYFKKIFEHFEKNLSDADMLLIIGYGGGDSEINELIFKNFKVGEKLIFITAKNINPFVEEFIAKSGAKVIQKYVQDLVPADFGL